MKLQNEAFSQPRGVTTISLKSKHMLIKRDLF